MNAVEEVILALEASVEKLRETPMMHDRAVAIAQHHIHVGTVVAHLLRIYATGMDEPERAAMFDELSRTGGGPIDEMYWRS